MIRITTVIGARPQFIKASVMSRFFQASGAVKEILVHTGQHFDYNMSEVFFSELKIPAPDYNLGINSSSHGKMTGKMLIAIEEVLEKEKPHYLLVYGDTNSTLAGALAAKKLHIPVIHIEAGLRSYNNRMPEEINRTVTDRISNLLCCPTDAAMLNLQKEGFDNFDCVYRKTGDVMEDSVRFHRKHFRTPPKILTEIGAVPNGYILATLHRAENTDDKERLNNIIGAFLEIASDTMIVLPLHPRTKSKLSELPGARNLKIIEPVGYSDNLQLIGLSNLVMTDSGGMQKEAYMMKKFCLTLRDETEWTELVDLSCNFVTGAIKKNIVERYHYVKTLDWNAPADIYGGGNAAEKIFNMITEDALTRGIV
jgi:UDP-GlcNAc3NAcA epimerase